MEIKKRMMYAMLIRSLHPPLGAHCSVLHGKSAAVIDRKKIVFNYEERLE